MDPRRNTFDEADQVAEFKRVYRRRYRNDLQGLRAEADRLEREISDVTITQQSFEGGSASGVHTRASLSRLRACNDLLAEFDDDEPLDTPNVAQVRFTTPS